MEKDNEVLTAAKKLPRKADGVTLADTFTANGNTYRWLDIGEIGIKAWTALSNMMDVFYFGQDSFQAQYDYLRKIAVDANGLTEVNEVKYHLNTRIQNFLDGIANKTKQRNHLAMHIAAIITLREGDDVREYSEKRVGAYVEDWEAEGFSPLDFFSIAASLSDSFKKGYQRTRKEILGREKIGLGATATNAGQAE